MKLTSKTDHLKALDQAHHLHPFTNLQEYASEGGRIISKLSIFTSLIAMVIKC